MGDPHAMSVRILEIKFVALGGTGAVGYGVDEDDREFAVDLDPVLAADIAAAIDRGRRPIVAVERPLYPEADSAPAVIAQVVARLHPRGAGDRSRLEGMPG
jgi:hypothetical protein